MLVLKMQFGAYEDQGEGQGFEMSTVSEYT